MARRRVSKLKMGKGRAILRSYGIQRLESRRPTPGAAASGSGASAVPEWLWLPAILGTALVWLTLLAPLGLALWRYLQTGALRVDYLLPAELFLVVVAGGLLLLWAALRAHTCRRLIASGLGAAILAVGLAQAIAQFTGLASGEAAATTWRIAPVIVLLVCYTLAVAALAVSGVVLSGRMVRARA